jgi:amidase
MPLSEHWHGMSVPGPLARCVLDAALFLDAVAGPAPGDAVAVPAPAEPFAGAARRAPRSLRIAVSMKVPPLNTARVSAESRRAVQETAELLRSLGHDVQQRDPAYGFGAASHIMRRYLRGIHDDARAMPNQDRLERRTRGVARLGSLVPAGSVARSRVAEPGLRRHVNSPLAEFDVLMTPVTASSAPAVGKWEGKGAIRTLNGVTRLCPFTPMWNVTGQPAASVPAGLDDAGMPLSVQLIAHPNDEATLLSLAAQIEAERPWAHLRPAIS